MTNQQLYTTVREHLLKQKARSTDAMGRCMYRGIGGLKCAVGILIPDEKYHPNLERCGVHFSPVETAAGLRIENRNLATELQIIHDCRPVEQWKEALDGAARIFDLKIEEPQS